MTTAEAKLLGLLVLAVEKHRGSCRCAACRYVAWALANFNNLVNL